MNRECVQDIWLALDASLRMELLETVAHGGARNPELSSLYWMAEEMLKVSGERVALEGGLTHN